MESKELEARLLDHFTVGAPSYRHANRATQTIARSKTREVMEIVGPYVTAEVERAKLDELTFVLQDTGRQSDARWTYENVKGRIAQLQPQKDKSEGL